MGTSILINTQEKQQQAQAIIGEIDLTKKIMRMELEYHDDNTLPMKKTWRMWMSETAKFMTGRGVFMPLYITPEGRAIGQRPFDPQDAHEMFTRKYLGVDGDGERYKTASGQKEKMLYMMDKHVEWATEKGLTLTIPRDGEYFKLTQSQEQ